MKKLMLFSLMLSLVFLGNAPAQSQTAARKTSKFSPHSASPGFTRSAHLELEEVAGDLDETDRLAELPPHLAIKKRWLVQSENHRAGLKPHLSRQRPLPLTPKSLKNDARNRPVQSFQVGKAQTLAGNLPEAWVARHNELGGSYDDAGAMVMDNNGNVYVTGSTSGSVQGHSDFLTIKYNSAGVPQWTADYSGSNHSDDEAQALAVDGDGNVYVTGSTSTADGEHTDYLTVKYDASGTRQWVARYDGSGVYNYNSAQAVAVDGNGNVYVTGSSAAAKFGHLDYLTIKYNSAGAQQWLARYTGPGDSDDAAIALAVDGLGNIYVTGSTGASSATGAKSDYLTIKYNAAGQQQWTARYTGTGNYHDYPVALVLDGAGNVYVTGVSRNGASNDYATIKYNSAGAQTWVKTYNGSGNASDYARALAVDAAGNVYVTGRSWSGSSYNYATLKYNAAGTQEWVTTFNGSGNGADYARGLAVDAAGNVHVTGDSWNGASEDFATIKYNSAGAQLWAKVYNGAGDGDDNAIAIAISSDGSSVYVAGSIYGSKASSDFGTIKYNASGVEQWVARYDDPGHADDSVADMVRDGSGNIYVTGSSGTIKYNSAGVKQWHAKEPGSAVAVDAAGNLYVTGRRWNGKSYDYATTKYNPDGTSNWTKLYDRAENVDDEPTDLSIDAAGNVYVTGTSDDGNFKYVTIKYNSAGAQQWAMTYDTGDIDHSAPALAVDPAGNVYVTGVAWDDANNARDYATIKYNAASLQQWVKTYNGAANDEDYSVAVALDGAGNVYVTGSSWSADDATFDYVTIKYNSSGDRLWVATYIGLEDGDAEVSALFVDSAANVYVTGSSWDDAREASDYATVKYNSSGAQMWVATYNGPGNGNDHSAALSVDGAGNVYVTGSSWNPTQKFYDFATVKYNSTGTPEATAIYNGPGNGDDDAVALVVDGAGNVHVAGTSFGAGTGFDFATIKYGSSAIPPTADAGPDQTIACAGNSVSIGGSPTGAGGSGGPFTYAWTPTTGLNNPTAPNPTASPATTITYTVTVTETASGLSATDNVTVTVPAGGWSVAHLVDVDDVILGVNHANAPRNNRGLALSPDARYLYLGYTLNKKLVRKIDLNVADPANNHSAVTAQLILPGGTQPARDIATDDRGRVYLALGTKVSVYNSALQTPALHTISGFQGCEGVAVRRESGKLVVYATDRLAKTLKRFVLIEGSGDAITSSSRVGLDGDGEVRIIGASSPRGLDLASNGTAWIADFGKGKVYRVNAAGQTVDSTGVNKAFDVAIDETRKEVYVSQEIVRTIKVLNQNTGKIAKTLAPPAADLKVNLGGANGSGALSGIAVASCQRVFVANEKGRSTLIGSPLDSPFSNTGDNNNVKAADTDPVLVVAGNVASSSIAAKESENEESEVASEQSSEINYQLEQNYPNPFNPSTTISFSLPEAGKVRVQIFDALGQLIRTLTDREMEAGRHTMHWNARNQFGNPVAGGVYLCRIIAHDKNGNPAFAQTQRMMFLK